MLENVLRFVAKFGDKEAQLIFTNGMPIGDIENMCLQILQYLGKVKETQAAQAAQMQAEAPKTEELVQPMV